MNLKYIWLPFTIVVLLDRITKLLIVNNMSLGESVEIIQGFFHLTYILNPGAAFGILAGQQWFFIVTAIIVLVFIIYFQNKLPADQRLLRVCMGMIAGGAIGNLIDRLFLSVVVDFLDFKIWPYIFNIADSMIVVGGLLMVILVYRMDKAAERKVKDG
ncbi:MAG: signal peptidase II [Peptococcaceae bacterium]|jgi:signal peptidase II|nr:signal peptidase II [Peptococcaceae bacterium]